MCQKDNSKKEKIKQHLSYEDRIKIEHMVNVQVLKYAQIARELGKNRSTIGREIRRGLVEQIKLNPYVSRNPKVPDYLTFYRYDALKAQKDYDAKASKKGPLVKIDQQLKEYIGDRLKKKYSPEVISYEIKQNQILKHKVCTNTIYSYIDKGILGLKREDLTYGRYKPKKKKAKEKDATTLSKLGRRIYDRPPKVDDKRQVGHWEMDTVEGRKARGEAALLVLTERVTNKEIIRKIESKTQKSVTSAINKLEIELGSKKFRERFRTITCDNGKEFTNWEALEKSIINEKTPRTKLFYADAYCSWQRGANENANKMIRRFLPKYTSINQVTIEEIALIEHWMNNYPRKKHGFKSANHIYFNLAS